MMPYINVKCWTCENRNPYPSEGNFYLCSDVCRAIHDAKAMDKEPEHRMNRAERRAAKKAGKNFH